MILLDTNIISELMKTAPAEKVLAWINQQENSDLFISTITIAEVQYGLQVLPDGKCQKLLSTRFEQFITQAFFDRVLFFTSAAAYIYGEIMGYRKTLGKPLSILDGQIAAIALANSMAVATRNSKDFIDCGLTVINPFE